MAQQRRGGFKRRKKVDYIAANKIEYVDYKDTELLSRFVSERGKIPSLYFFIKLKRSLSNSTANSYFPSSF